MASNRIGGSSSPGSRYARRSSIRVLAHALVVTLCLCGAALEVSADEGAPLVLVHDGRISVRLEGAPLGRVLDMIERALDLRVHLPGSLSERATWCAFDDLSVDAAMARLLTGVSYAVVRGTDDTDAASSHAPHMQVYILATGTQHDAAKGLAHAGGGADGFSAAWSGKRAVSPNMRLSELETAYQTGAPGFEGAVESALADRDVDVREGAFEMVAYTIPDTKIAAERKLGLIERVAHTESDAGLRMQALHVLSDLDPERAEPIIREVILDEDARVRNEAEALLEAIQTDLATSR